MAARRYAHGLGGLRRLVRRLRASCSLSAPRVLAGFLADHPTVGVNQRRQATVINAIHIGTKHPVPGRSEAIRQLLTLRERTALVGLQRSLRSGSCVSRKWVADGIVRPPRRSHPSLVAAGLSFEEIAHPRRIDISADPTPDQHQWVWVRLSKLVYRVRRAGTLTPWLDMANSNYVRISSSALLRAAAPRWPLGARSRTPRTCRRPRPRGP